MRAGKKEATAIVGFLTNLKHYRNDRKRLFKKAEEYPELVALYVDTLSEKEKKEPLIQSLIKTAKIR